MIEFSHVYMRYPNGFEALKDIDLTIPDGSFVAIIGRSGAGKSTLIRTINKLYDTSEGSIVVDGTKVEELRGASLRRFRRKVGMIFQSFNLITRTTVLRNVLTAFVPDIPWWRALLGVFTKQERMAALGSLDKVGILDKAYVRCDQLSGGQQQRVAIARALALEPAYLLFDEPTSALDPELEAEVIRVLMQLAKEGRSLVIVTHNMAFAKKVADRIVFLENGTLRYNGEPNGFFASDDERIRKFLTVYDSSEYTI